MQAKTTATFPPVSQRMPCKSLASPHPSVIDQAKLLEQCELRTQRRSGPGGQHRNKTSSGVFLTHLATGIVGEATERRSQAQNRDVALTRLRYLLATEIRTPSPLDADTVNSDPAESGLRNRFQNSAFRLNDNNHEKPGLLALVLNDLWIAGGQPSLITEIWSVSTSRIVHLIRSHGPSLTWVNRLRAHHNRYPLH